MTDVDIFEDLPVSEVAEPDESIEIDVVSETTEAPEWPKIVSEVPEGALTVSQFVDHLNKQLVGDETKRLLDAGASDPISAVTEALTVQVGYQNVSQAVNAKNNPLPHYIVRTVVKSTTKTTNDEGEEVEVETEKNVDRAYLPVDIALDAWKNRPTRSAGRPSEDSDTNEGRALRAGKAFAALDAANARLARVTTQVAALTNKVDKHKAVLARNGLTEEDATNAYTQWKSAQDADKEISDETEADSAE